MSTTATRKKSLSRIFERRAFVVFVSRERDLATLRRGKTCQWTVPSAARPGDCLVIYKPGASKGSAEEKKPPFEAFVAAGVVYGVPLRIEKGFFNAPIDEVTVFPSPVPRAIVAKSFSEWVWLRSMRGRSGVRIPAEIEAHFLSMIDRLAFQANRRTAK
jgi:hypothetical protein